MTLCENCYIAHCMTDCCRVTLSNVDDFVNVNGNLMAGIKGKKKGKRERETRADGEQNL